MPVTYTPLPPAPVVGSATFETDAGNLLAALPGFQAEIKAIADDIEVRAAVIDVGGSATLASLAAAQASRNATAAAKSASDAKTSGSSAALSASAAKKDAEEASVSALQAAEMSVAAAGSAEDAAASAALADSAGNATAAQAARTEAETAEDNAKAAQTAAEAAQVDAESARDLSIAWATKIGGPVVEGEGYSAKHYAADSIASASQAAASATSAADSARTATTKAAESFNSASQAVASAASSATSSAIAATKATEAATAATAANAASAAINVTANVSAWSAATNYAIGTVVYSPSNYQNYRRIVAGTTVTDPKDDPTNWKAVGFGPAGIGTDPNQVPVNGYLGNMAYQDADNVNIGGGILTGQLRRRAPVTKTSAFAVADNEHWLIFSGTASIAVTLPDVALNVGREIMIKTVAAFAVVSASSNVIPLAGGPAGTAILAATAGKYATLVSDGTSWIIMQAN